MDFLTIEEATRRVHQIADAAGDDEAAHSMEDALHREALATIASIDNMVHAKELALVVLRTLEIDFARWCA